MSDFNDKPQDEPKKRSLCVDVGDGYSVSITEEIGKGCTIHVCNNKRFKKFFDVCEKTENSKKDNSTGR